MTKHQKRDDKVISDINGLSRAAIAWAENQTEHLEGTMTAVARVRLAGVAMLTASMALMIGGGKAEREAIEELVRLEVDAAYNGVERRKQERH